MECEWKSGSTKPPIIAGPKSAGRKYAALTCRAVYDRDALGEGTSMEGPALLAGDDSTCLLVGGQVAEVDAIGMLVVR